jgi:SprT protein
VSKPFSQLEFRFPSWVRNLAKTPQTQSPLADSTLPDPGLTTWCREQAIAFSLPELSRKVRVTWNPRMRTTAGRAWWPTRLIELNPKLKDISEDAVWRTLKHEFAHLLAYERCGKRKIDPHGPEWQIACSELGIPGEHACHSLPLKGRKLKRKYHYVCPACLSIIKRVRPINKPLACYSCCKKFNSGTYHERFRLIENKI